jgi:competence protein ComEC
VVVPHHGSRTSSSAELVNAVRARYALVSAGYNNRYGFPDAEVSERWRRSGATVLNTAETGALMIALNDDGTSTLARFRDERRRYWHR